MDMKIKYISLEKAVMLQESISWLENLEKSNSEIYVVGENLDNIDIKFTHLLHELIILNKRRDEIIDLFRNEVE